MNKPAKVTATATKPIDKGLAQAATIESTLADLKGNGNRYGQTIWNALFTTLGLAILGVMGWQSLAIMSLQNDMASFKATRFTEADGQRMLNELRNDVTDISTDIDKRLALMENNTIWMRTLIFAAHGDQTHSQTFNNVESALPKTKVPIPLAPKPPTLQLPLKDGTTRKYDIRQSIQQSLKRK